MWSAPGPVNPAHTPNPSLSAECQAGRFWVPFLPVFGVTRPGSEPTPSFLAAIYTVGVFNQQEFEVMVKLIT